MKQIKPEDVLSIDMATALSFAVFTATTLFISHVIYWFDSTGVQYDPVFKVVFGLIWSLSTIPMVVYLKAILLTREKDMRCFAEMHTLRIIALSPIIFGILQYSTDPDGLNIPFARDAVCLVAAFAMIAELYLTIRTYTEEK